MNTADVIIIGAGVIGTSIAFHLAKSGCTDVAVLEKNYIGSGSTEKCAGGIRQQFSLEANIRLSMESVQFFNRFESETGHAADFRQNGYLLLATTEAELGIFRTNVELQRKLGLDVILLSGKEVSEFIPQLRTEDILGAAFCPGDGYADPYSVVTGFASAAKSLGVIIHEETEVTGINLEGDRISRVRTTAGDFTTPVVVNATGPYAGEIGGMVNLDIPVRPSKRHIFVTEPVNERAEFAGDPNWPKLPMVVDFHSGFWFRREGPCLIFGMRNPEERESFDTEVDWSFFTSAVAPEACHRLPCLADTGVMRAQAGLHSDTPDGIAIIDKAPGMEGLYLACGFSGHGFMHAPAVGRLMAEMILEKPASLPGMEIFSFDRFKKPIQQKEQVFI